MILKKCSTCQQDKSKDNFYKCSARADGLYHSCKECKRQYTKKYYKQNKERLIDIAIEWRKGNNEHVRALHRKRTYGLESEQYEKLLAHQNSKCPICNTILEKNSAVDHCHMTGKVRGILCGPCNRGLGLLKDNIENMMRAINYLKKSID